MGYPEIPLQFDEVSALQDSGMRQELARLLEQVHPIISFTRDEIESKWPSIRMHQMVDAERLQVFLDAWDWYVEQVRSS